MMRPSRPEVTVGLVCPSRNGHWLGGLYHLQHLIRSCAVMEPGERVAFRDVWWNEAPPETDPFVEVRAAVNAPVSVSLPTRLWPRLLRRVRRSLHGTGRREMSDLFLQAGVNLLFPVPPCDHIGIPLAGWILDFQYRRLPHYYTEEHWRSYEDRTRRVGEQAAVLMVSSDDIFKDLQTFMPELAGKARIVRPCSAIAAEELRLDPAAVARQHGLPERFFLISNQICSHKNHRTIFEAMRLLAARGIAVHTVCTGKPADFRDPTFFARLSEDVERWNLAGQIHFVGALPRNEYLALLRQCLAVLQPSEFEGWGFALSDAKALGKPVFASDIAVHHEHEHPALTLLPTHDVDAWAAALATAWRDLQPGPDPHREEQAAVQNQADCLRVGQEMNALFIEALAGGRCR